jgi:hypothetical protein
MRSVCAYCHQGSGQTPNNEASAADGSLRADDDAEPRIRIDMTAAELWSSGREFSYGTSPGERTAELR